ncbi:MAG TPA: hypothetical protein VIN09_06020 [Chloroflexota bacterium]
MPRGLFAAVAALALVLVVAVVATAGIGFTAANPGSDTAALAAAQQQQRGALPPELAFLRDMSWEQRFDHLLGVRATFRNPEGQEVVVHAIPGTVVSTTESTLTLQPNGATEARTFRITPDTFIAAVPEEGTTQYFSPGERAVVAVVGDSDVAMAIIDSRGGFHLRHGLPEGMLEG